MEIDYKDWIKICPHIKIKYTGLEEDEDDDFEYHLKNFAIRCEECGDVISLENINYPQSS